MESVCAERRVAAGERLGGDGALAEALLAQVADWRWAMDAEFRIVRAEPLAEGRRLPPLPALIGYRPWECPALVLDERRRRRHERLLWQCQPFRGVELAWRTDRGRQRWFSISGVPRLDEQGHFHGYVGVATDVTARRRVEQSLRDVRAELDATLRALPDLMFEIDGDGVFHGVHAPQPELLAVPAERIVGRRDVDLLPPEVVRITHQALDQAREHGAARGHRYRIKLADGVHWFEMSVARKAGRDRYVVVVRDITELNALAFYDPLTGLPNRRLLLDRVEQALLRLAREPDWAALLFIDVDDFKRVNDTLGHAAGDRVLQELAQRMRAVVRSSDPLGRLGGDEFLALLTDLGTDLYSARRTVQRVGSQLRERLSQPIAWHGGVVTVSLSIGGVLFRGAQQPDRLMQAADQLMYRAKDRGKNAIAIQLMSALVRRM
ncbi:diguanylate cyclase domain-containing protein [Tepidimonas taiwanensis]|uniref:Diguanylate cyclase DosC n=1 Tax=Tepidimonas taiwanensis TaxID=307486 RepID=A0A554XBG9_9BURK|nr:diguanylate cyclase [Tepidimonas taiwanensis]MDM7463174.1 diguanylate cyclase [Tepidimonas taiwanensis]TSE33180.1 Diguanylate cyclase DosC [Tepidimonas taiwanensis]